MNKWTKLALAAILFLIYGAIALYSGWFEGSARRAEEKLESAVAANLNRYDIDDVDVKMEGQLAIVSGTAKSESEKDKIIRTVRSAEWSGGLISGGVTVIRADNLQVVELPDVPETPFVWTAEKDTDGSVLLAGMIPSEAAREALMSYARARFPQGVVDRMSVARNVPPGDWVSAAKVSLDTLSQLQDGRANANGDKFNVTGSAASREIARVAEENLRIMPKGFRGQPNISSPRPPGIESPYVWSAIMDGMRKPIILNGYVPDTETQLSIIEYAESIFKQRIVDRMVVARGVPSGDWHGSVKSTLTALASLQTGRVDARDLEFTVTGVAPTQQVADNARAKVSELAGDYLGAAELTVAPPPKVQAVDQCQALFDSALTGTTINFETSKAKISNDSFELLDRLGVAAKRCSAFNITIAGHTDSVGSEVLNQRLSERRAQAVVDYLIEGGVAAGQMSARGFGESNPIGDNSTSEGRAQNRRIEFTIEK